MYNITDDVLVPKMPKYIAAGIQSVKLVDVTFKVSDKGKPFFVYNYENSLGQRLSKTEWQVNLPANFNTMEPKDKRKYEAVIEAQKQRILKVASLFVPIEQLKGNFDSFTSFCTFIKTKIEATNYKEVPLRIKAVFDKDGWITTPTYTYSEWIEREDKVSSDNSQIAIIEGKDQLIRPTVKKDEEIKATSPLIDTDEVKVKSGASDDELPF